MRVFYHFAGGGHVFLGAVVPAMKKRFRCRLRLLSEDAVELDTSHSMDTWAVSL